MGMAIHAHHAGCAEWEEVDNHKGLARHADLDSRYLRTTQTTFATWAGQGQARHVII